MGVAATPKCKENAYWKNKEREEFGGFVHEFFYHHALFVGYNVTNTLYKGRKRGLRAYLQKIFYKCTSDNAVKIPLRKLIQGYQKNPLVEELYGSIYLNLSG